jgi:hypothetical protein
MMKATLFAALLCLLPAPPLLPSGALVIEARTVAPDRELVLWMLSPDRYPRDVEPDEPYTCPEETRGSFYRGRTRVSLVDTRTRRAINTVEIKEDDGHGVDEFDVPYRIHAGSYYHVEGVPKDQEERPTLLWLQDYNGDGKALEVAFFSAWACMGLQTTLIGYSERKDQVIQYPVHLEMIFEGKRSAEVLHWVDYLFSKKPQSPGHWLYEIDYRGRGGSLDRYEIRYDQEAERFEGTQTSVK